MADFFVLLNSGDFVLLNSGDKVLLNGEPEVVEVPPRTISHVTIDAGVDLRKRKRGRTTQILKLSVEVPATGKSIRKQRLIVDCEGACKSTIQSNSFSVHLPLLEKQTIPMTCTAFSKQKTLFSVIGTKDYHKTLVRNTKLQRNISEIYTLMELMRMADEE